MALPTAGTHLRLTSAAMCKNKQTSENGGVKGARGPSPAPLEPGTPAAEQPKQASATHRLHAPKEPCSPAMTARRDLFMRGRQGSRVAGTQRRCRHPAEAVGGGPHPIGGYLPAKLSPRTCASRLGPRDGEEGGLYCRSATRPQQHNTIFNKKKGRKPPPLLSKALPITLVSHPQKTSSAYPKEEEIALSNSQSTTDQRNPYEQGEGRGQSQGKGSTN
jgi:hypothetical protein